MNIQNLLDSEDAAGLAEWVPPWRSAPGELLEAVIDRIEWVEPQLNAVAERLYTSAREAARTVQPGHGVFAGVPTLIKDLFSPVNGAAMDQRFPGTGRVSRRFEAELVTRLRRAGCVIAGTSTSPDSARRTPPSPRALAPRATPGTPATVRAAPAVARPPWWRRVSSRLPMATTAAAPCACRRPAAGVFAP